MQRVTLLPVIPYPPTVRTLQGFDRSRIPGAQLAPSYVYAVKLAAGNGDASYTHVGGRWFGEVGDAVSEATATVSAGVQRHVPFDETIANLNVSLRAAQENARSGGRTFRGGDSKTVEIESDTFNGNDDRVPRSDSEIFVK